MPMPRHEDSARHGDPNVKARSLARLAAPAVRLTARVPSEAESARRRRRGHRAPVPSSADFIWREHPSNGWPLFKPYVYRGLGYDIYEGAPDET